MTSLAASTLEWAEPVSQAPSRSQRSDYSGRIGKHWRCWGSNGEPEHLSCWGAQTIRFYKRDGSACHIEANKSTPQWRAWQTPLCWCRSFILCFACLSVSVCTCVPAWILILMCLYVHLKCLHLKGVALITQRLLLQASPPASQCLSGAGEEEGKWAGAHCWVGPAREGRGWGVGGGWCEPGQTPRSRTWSSDYSGGGPQRDVARQPCSSARKSCHQGSSATPRASHPVCQHPNWGTETRVPSRPGGSPKDRLHLPSKNISLIMFSMSGSISWLETKFL